MSQWLRKKKGEKFEDTKEVIRIRKSKKDRQHNDQKEKSKKYKRKKEKITTNDLQNTTQTTNYRATRITLKTGVNSGAPER